MPLDEILTSRWTPKPPSQKFNWYGDPADKFRGKGGKARITPSDTAEMLAYNRRLTAPDGGSGLFQPPVAAPTAPLPTTNAGIEAQYGTGRPGFVSVRPSSPTAPVSYPIAPAPPGTDPRAGLSDATNPETTNGRAGVASPALTSTPRVDPPSISTPLPAPDIVSRAQPAPIPGTGIQSDIGGGGIVNPNTGSVAAGGKTIADEEAERIARLRAQGASDATIHRMQVQAGIRPNIDARSTQSPLNSTTSAEIQAGWAKQRADKLAQLRQSATQ